MMEQAQNNEDISNGPIQEKACRPFQNSGNGSGESAQFIILMEDSLAVVRSENIWNCSFCFISF